MTDLKTQVSRLPARGPGRPKGLRNKTTRQVKQALLDGFDGLGGMDAFVEWAREHPTEFYKLYAKLLPLEVRADVSHSGTITYVVETGVSRAPDKPTPEAT